MVIEAMDPRPLCVPPSRKAIVLRLRRSIKYHSQSFGIFENSKQKTVVDHIETGVWGPRRESCTAKGESKHVYMGEIPLKNNLAPSSAIGSLSIEVCVV